MESESEDREPLLSVNSYANLPELDPKTYWRRPSCWACGRRPRWQAALISSCVLVSVVVFLGVAVIVGIYGVAPHLVQSTVDSADLTFESITLSQPTPDTLYMNAEVLMKSDKMFGFIALSASISPTKLSLFYRGSNFGHIDFPGADLKSTELLFPTQTDYACLVGSDNRVKLANVLYITNGTALSQFLADTLRLPNVTSQVSAKVTVSSLGLSFDDISLNKQTVLKGLDNLNNAIKVNSLQLPADEPTPPGGVHVILNSTVTNPSIAAMYGTGDVTFGCYFQGYLLGKLVAKDFNLQPGETIVILTGYINPEQGALPSAGDLFSQYLSGSDSHVTVKALDMSTSVPWLREAMIDLTVNSTLAPYPHPPITNISSNTFGLDFESAPIPLVNGSLVVTISVPFDFKYQVVEFAGELLMALPNGTLIAKSSVPWSPATSNQDLHQVYMNFSKVLLEIVDEGNFSEFLASVLLTPTATLLLYGNSSVAVNSSIGVVRLQNVPFKSEITVAGLDSFKRHPVTLAGADLAGSSNDTLSLILSTSIEGDSNSIVAGPLSVLLSYENVIIGNGSLPSFDLFTGKNILNGTGYAFRNPENEVVLRQFLTRYAEGQEQQALLLGVPESTKHKVLRYAIGQLQCNTIIPAAPERKMLIWAQLEFSLVDFLRGYLKFKLTIQNPFGLVIHIYHASYVISTPNSKGKLVTIGQVSEDIDVTINAKQQLPVPDLEVKVIGWTVEELETLFGSIVLHVNGTFTATFGQPDTGFHVADLPYEQHDLPASFYPQPGDVAAYKKLLSEQQQKAIP